MRSLRARLVLVPTAILFIGLAATLLFIVGGARARVQAEVGSGLRLGALVVRDALHAAARAPDPAAAYAELRADFPEVRHVRFDTGGGASPPAASPPAVAPHWFARLLAPPRQTIRFAVALPGVSAPPIVMQSNPADEIDEIWSEVLLLAAVLAGVWAALTAVISATVAWSLRPLRLLAGAFDRLERGDHAHLPATGVTEIRRIAAPFNRLADTLARVTHDNHLLIDRLMLVQEAERRELAHELHDEIGPSLFGIRADAACIRRWCRDHSDPLAGTIEECATSIDALTDGIQQINYRMLDRLRPLVLNEMGLADAVLALVDGWRARLPEVAWSVGVQPGIAPGDEERALTLYRFVQEGLTNIARHAGARHVVLSIGQAPDGTLSARLADDGRGPPPEMRYGFGLLGMNERVRRLRGRLAVQAGAAGGTVLDIMLPPPGRRDEPAPPAPTPHATGSPAPTHAPTPTATATPTADAA